MVAIKCIAKSARRKANRIQKRSLKSETLRRRSHLPTSAEMTLQYPPNIPDTRVQRLPRHELQAILVMTLCATIAGADKTGGGGMDV